VDVVTIGSNGKRINPIAIGKIAAVGSIISQIGIAAASRWATGNYAITTNISASNDGVRPALFR
jgi:hypothetical protein